MRLKSLLTPALLALLLSGGSAFAQKSAIEGVASDAKGGPLKKASVRIQQEDARTPAIVLNTDAKGHFVASNLPAGTYTVAVLIGGRVKYSAAHVKAPKGQTVQLSLGGMTTAVATTNSPGKKHALWVPEQTGSHLGGHWEDQPDRGPGTSNVDGMSSEQLRRIQNVPMAVPSTGGR
jgi:Carboxypeptidase regulatory-like domain